MSKVFHALEELGVVSTEHDNLDVFDWGGSNGIEEGEVVVGGVGSGAENDGVGLRVEVELVAEVVMALFLCEWGFVKVGPEEEAEVVVAFFRHVEFVRSFAGVEHGSDEMVGVGVDPAVTEAVGAMEFSAVGDGQWRAVFRGFFGKLKEAVVEVRMSTEYDVGPMLLQDSGEAFASVNHPWGFEVWDSIQVMKVEVVSEGESFLDEVVEVDAKVVEVVCIFQGLVNHDFHVGGLACRCVGPCLEGLCPHVVSSACTGCKDEDFHEFWLRGMPGFQAYLWGACFLRIFLSLGRSSLATM